MFIIVQHQVKDPAHFFNDIPSVAQNAPPGVHPHLFCPAEDQTAAVCLWQADSVDSVRTYIDAVAGTASENTYLVVDEGFAIGLPTAPALR